MWVPGIELRLWWLAAAFLYTEHLIGPRKIFSPLLWGLLYYIVFSSKDSSSISNDSTKTMAINSQPKEVFPFHYCDNNTTAVFYRHP